jgi:tyrosinase
VNERSLVQRRRWLVRNELYDALDAKHLRPLGITRRDFLRMTAFGAVAAVIDGCNGQGNPWATVLEILSRIINRPVRRDLGSLAANDPLVLRYAEAVKAMKALDASGDKRGWTYQQSIHTSWCPHGNWLFLPWHREYVYRFEEICREVLHDDSFALPYWNWQEMRKVPAGFRLPTSPLYHPRSPWTILGSAIPWFYTASFMMEAILSETCFLDFASGALSEGMEQTQGVSSGPLEGIPHDNIHVWLGGDMAGINTSPRDPIFWMHHNMIECVWVEWNVGRRNPNTNDPRWTNHAFTEFIARDGTPAPSITPLGMALYPLFLYRYDNPPLGLGG